LWRRSEDPQPAEGRRLVVGLGNPGSRYANTKHNAGFMIVDRLAERAGLRFSSSKHRADIAVGTVESVPVMLAKPVTYMNESGNAVSRLLAYYQIPLPNLLVVYDEIDLPFGTIRLRPSGSSAGNRGIASIIQSLATDDFARLRFGVGRPPGNGVAHVLGPFPPEEAPLLPRLLDVAGDAVLAVWAVGIQAAMNTYNRNWLSEVE
jgi:PTH1 family peptidyl-tRNA hydrolase